MDGANNNLETFRPDPNMSEQVGDDFTDEQAADLADYPPLAKQGNCAKDWDAALLQNFLSNRIRIISRQYDGVSSRLNKPELFKAIFDAMMEVQDCGTCTGGTVIPPHISFPHSRILLLGMSGAPTVFS